MKKIIIFMIIISLLGEGCAYNITRNNNEDLERFFTRINEVCKNQESLIIKTLEGKLYTVRQLQIANNTVGFFNCASEQYEKIGTNKIDEIEFIAGEEAGEFAGFAFGSLAGGGLTAIFYPPSSGEGKQGRAVAIICGIVAGGIGGIIFGNNLKNKTTIKFPNKEIEE